MALLGKAVLINWSNVLRENRPQYYDWHDREHMRGRLGLHGFLRGRRLWACEADRDVLNLYEVADLDVLTGRAYSHKASNPSPAYRSAGKIITDAVRALAHVRYSRGTAVGGWMLTVRHGLSNASNGSTQLIEKVFPRILDIRGVVGLHLCVADQLSSAVVTKDREGRPTAVPDWSILVEATTLEALEACQVECLTDGALIDAGCIGPFLKGTYSLQMLMTKQDLGIDV